MEKQQPPQKDRTEHKPIDRGERLPERIERQERPTSRGALNRIQVSAGTIRTTTNANARALGLLERRHGECATHDGQQLAGVDWLRQHRSRSPRPSHLVMRGQRIAGEDNDRH